jgi:hypothetical protein
MRHLAEPEVLKSAGSAAFVTAVLCYPRLALWPGRPFPIWHLEATIFLGTVVLWAFVFAWHTRYSQRPVFTLNVEASLWALATAAGLVVTATLHLFLDPTLRATTPQDYPSDFKQWVAMTFFNLAFVQLFLLFAPVAWLLRLFHNRRIATLGTVLFGLVVLGLKAQASTTPFPLTLFASLFILRIGFGLLTVALYFRGGVALVSWWSFLLEARHLLDLAGGS